MLGVGIRQLDPQTDNVPGLPAGQKGLMVVQVVENSPADRAGLRAGDVILSINGINVENPALFGRLVQRFGASGQVELELWKEGAASKLAVALEQAPAGAQTAERAPPSEPASPPPPPQKTPSKGVGLYHGHLGFQIGPLFENLSSSPAELSDVTLDGENYSATISTGTGFIAEISLDAHTDAIFSLGFGLLYLFNNNLDEEGDRISYLAPTILGRITLKFTDWLETRTVLQMGSGLHLGTRLTLWKDEVTKKPITQWWDMEMFFFKAGQEVVFYPTEEIGVVVNFGMLFSTGYLDIQDKEYSFGLPPLLFLTAGAEWR